MSELRDLILMYPELGEVLAEIENRLLYLEHSQPIRDLELEPKPSIVEPEWTSKQWDTITQLKSMVLYLQEKVNTLTDKKAVDKQYTIK